MVNIIGGGRTHDFIMVEYSELWDVIEDGPFVPSKAVKIGDTTSQVPKTK